MAKLMKFITPRRGDFVDINTSIVINMTVSILFLIQNIQRESMFGKTIRNIQTSRNGVNGLNYGCQISNGFNSERSDRYPQVQQQNKNSQRKTVGSGQFSQLKKAENKVSQLVIRQCDVNEFNHYKKNTPRQPQQVNSIYQFAGNSSNKKERVGIGSRKTYDSSFKEPLEEIHFSDRDNISKPSDRVSLTYQHSSNALYEMQQQIQYLKQYILHIHQDQQSQLKKNKSQVKRMQIECMGQLQNFATQISKELNKQKQDMNNMNQKGIQNQRELRHLKDSFNSFVKDSQEKIQSLVLDINEGGNLRKSRNNEQFGVDLKSSLQCINGGVGTSMSVNFHNENINLKLYNEMSAQIQALKGELENCKQKVEILEKDTKIMQLQKKNSKQQTKEGHKQKIDLRQVQRMIIEKFSQQRKKNLFSEKIQDLDLKTKDLYKIYQDTDSNIKGMNIQFARVINGTVIKKQKLLQCKLNAAQEKITQLNQKISPERMQQTVRSQVKVQLKRCLEQKSSSIKVVKIRQPTAQETMKLEAIKQSQSTYLIDQEGHLLDCAGNYIVQLNRQTAEKQKIKIQKNVLYLLEAQGIQVKAI